MKLSVEFLGLSRRRVQLMATMKKMSDQARLRGVMRLLIPLESLSSALITAPETFDLSPSYMIHTNGRRVDTDLDQRLQDGQRLILMFADLGG